MKQIFESRFIQSSFSNYRANWFQLGFIAATFQMITLSIAEIRAQDHIGAGRSPVASSQSDEWNWPEMQPKTDPHVKNADFTKPVMDANTKSRLEFDAKSRIAPSGDEAARVAHSDLNGIDQWKLTDKNSWSAHLGRVFGSTDIVKMIGSLALVLGGYFGFVWVWRKANPRAAAGLPQEVVDVVGIAPFGPRKTLQLVRLGTKLLLLVNGPEGTQPIGEITEPKEVEYLATLCSSRKPARRATDSAAAFRRLANHIQQPSTQTVRSTDRNANQPSLEQVVHSLQNVIRHTSGENVFEA